MFACAALAQYELTGAETYYGMTSIDNRRSPADFTTTGWFSGPVPITVPITVSSFGDTVRAAQASFDSGKDSANVLFGQVLELAPWLRPPQTYAPRLFFFDVGGSPLSALFDSQVDGLNVRATTSAGLGWNSIYVFFGLRMRLR